MSRESVEVVRQPIEVSASSRRSPEEWFGLAFPAVLAWLVQLVWRRPPRSRIRQAFLRRALKLGVEAYNRRDYEAAVVLYHPEVEYIPASGIVALGLDPAYHGREARIRAQEEWSNEWGDFLFKPEEVIDMGDDRVLAVGRMEGSGLGSGVALDNEWADLLLVSGGRVIREHVFLDRAEALEAVGLRE